MGSVWSTWAPKQIMAPTLTRPTDTRVLLPSRPEFGRLGHMSQQQDPSAPSQTTDSTGQIADTTGLLAMSRRAGRQYSLYFVLLGAAALVLGFLLAVMSWEVAIPVGLLIIAACIAALGKFVNSNQRVVGEFNHFARPFWGVYLVALLVAIGGVLLWKDHAWMGWVGGGLGLLDGLVAGHFVDRASKASTAPAASSALH